MAQFTKQVIEGGVGVWEHVEPSLDDSIKTSNQSIPKHILSKFIAMMEGTARGVVTPASEQQGVVKGQLGTGTGGKFRELEPKQVLVVTTDDHLLKAAKDMGFFTLKYRPHANSLFGQVSTDFMATSSIEVQDAVEEMNGVGLRQSAFKHRGF